MRLVEGFKMFLIPFQTKPGWPQRAEEAEGSLERRLPLALGGD